jgi:hypothetical protein
VGVNRRWATVECQNERWLQLAELASKEQDFKKLMELVSEVNKLLEEKHKRFTGEGAESE